MPIKNFELTSIEGRRFAKLSEKLINITTDINSTVTLITEMNDREANIDYRFSVIYRNVGMIKMEGTIIYEGNAPQIAQQWAKEHNMPHDVAQEVHSAIMTNCIPGAILIARDLHLPPPIPPPPVNIPPPPKFRPSRGSSEVA